MADIPAQVFVQLYSKLAAALSVSGTVGKDPSAILSLQIPGLYIQPGLDVNNPKTQYYVSNALNSTLACAWTVFPKSATVSDVYKSILDGKETPLVKLTPEQQKELEAAYNTLFEGDGEPSKKYTEYSKYQLSYFHALDNYEAAAATANNGGEPVPKALVKALKKAERQWTDFGYRGEIDLAIATVAQYESYEPLKFWSRLSERYSNYTRTAGIDSQFQYVTSNPPYELWFQEFGWSDFLFDKNDFENQNQSGGTGVGENCCCCCYGKEDAPAASPLGRLRYLDESAGDLAIDESFSGFLLTCRIRRIDILRPWMDTNVFYSRAWRWSPASVSYGVRISTGGDIAGRVVPTGVMPVLPTTAILARDVEIYWNDGGAIARRVSEHIQRGKTVRFGPFQLTRARLTDEHHISMPDPQLIGFISTLLPKCPNPDSTLPWPLGESLFAYDRPPGLLE